MDIFRSRLGLKSKKFIVGVLERLMSRRRMQSYLFFWARTVVSIRKPFIIGITGSVGKSTTTEMLAAVLVHPDAARTVGSVGYAFENMNDDVGLPAIVLRFSRFDFPYAYPSRLALLCQIPFQAFRVAIGDYPKILVLEFGTHWGGHLHRLVEIAPPNVAVVTTIGAAHLERLKTLEGVVLEKGALVLAVPTSGLVILGQDHDYVPQLEQMARAPVVKVTGRGIELARNITRAVCRHLGISDETVALALKDFKSPAGRLTQIDLTDMTVIDDSFNANPLSMKLALDTLAQTSGQGRRRLAILGEMAELGKEGQRYHEEIGTYARGRTDILIGVGDLSRHYSPDVWFDSSDACADQLQTLVRLHDCVLVKGSGSTRMEQIVKRLCVMTSEGRSTLLSK